MNIEKVKIVADSSSDVLSLEMLEKGGVIIGFEK